MLDDPQSWLHERSLLPDIQGLLNQGNLVVLHGEAGTGKTTALRLLQGQIERSGGPRFFIVVDFNQMVFESRINRSDGETQVMGSILVEIERVLSGHEMSDQILRGRDRIAFLSRDEYFALSRAHMRSVVANFEDLSHAEIDHIIDGHPDVAEAYAADRNRYYAEASARLRAIDLLRAASALAHVTIAIDNIDVLVPTAHDVVGDAAHALSLAGRNRVGVLVACRTLHLKAMTRNTLEAKQTIPVASMPLPNGPEWDLKGIILKRLALVADSGSPLVKTIVDGMEAAEERSFRGDLARQIRNVEATINLLWGVSEPNGSAEMADSLVEWHNGNIRDCMQSISSISRQVPDAKQLAGVDNTAVVNRKIRDAFYRHIAMHIENTDGTYRLRPSVEVFSARHIESTDRSLPFYFARFRLLALLAHRETVTTLGEIVSDLGHLGLHRAEIVAVLNQLTKRQGLGSGYVRFEDQLGPIQSIDGRCDDVTIEILHAGRYLVNRLAVTCEYLFWCALAADDCYTELSELTGGGHDLRRRNPTDYQKVLGASIFLHRYLLPRLYKEHPYMREGSAWDDVHDRNRLRAFSALFGYERGRWLIQRIVAEVGAFANRNGIERDEPIRRCFDEIDRCVERLDLVLGG
ncbi:MAG: ATP-binding protein [Actinomycetota bacterium]